ncbi:SusC/RagA family TonB-linked outer membrane protein [Hymenobacter busanensis]|uniref:SusC/RagA family TonB-linked outer membrane protein n=1 Tax=Hymenobacter busanensis TaxID=2607656 RepID=A0A7L5A2Q0_9BACT|nr:SusC/RagA family TonB-linked outer membrane protein [Hymenobacter busanensis]KAA9338169.1 SusC/RagA family TonB-linked outer membrane protein [Hymenobacter busanensis]QHJ09406.1 SusC/RagA family TonB-linked outer membrane protein [Hymenobacter busanensis]
MKKLLWSFLVPGLLAAQQAQAQTRTVTGVVKGAADGAPLPGVNVVVKGSTTGTQTDAEGRYSLQAAPGATLVFSFIGYNSVERAVDATGNVDISLTAATSKLDEVVVTAFGIKQERRQINYGAQQVQAAEIIETRQPNLVNALQGKIAGVNITSSGGAPGEGASIVIRGGNSLGADNQPLFVIDGVIMDNSTFSESTAPGGGSGFNGIVARSVSSPNRAGDINPEDIASITVLKGPAAAALYGLRAGNGAVIITTKKGAAGRTSITYRTQFSVDEVNRLPELQGEYKQGTNGVFDPTTRNSWGPRFEPNEAIYDNLGDFFRTGKTFQNYLTASGGSEKATFFLSASRLDQTGVVPESQYDKTSVRLTSTVQLSPKLSATASANYLNSGATRPFQGQGLFGNSLQPSGFFTSLLNWPRNDDARNYLNPDGTRRRLLGNSTPGNDPDNPYFTVYRNPQSDRTNRMIGNATLNYDPAKWLGFTYTLGTDFYNERTRSVRAPGTSQPSNQDGGLAETVNLNRVLTSNFLATLRHQFTENIRGSLLLGNAIEQNKTEANDFIGTFFYNPNFVSINTTANRNVLQRFSTRRIVGNFARLNLDLFQQVTVELSGRYDMSSTLPRPNKNKNYGKGFFYGSAAVGYEFTRTLGLDQNPVLNYGKLRASVAEVGKDTGPYRVESPLTNNTTIGAGLRNNFFGSNPNLKPERTRSYEAGLDLQFLKNRLGLDLSVYQQETRDQLVAPRVSQATGFILQYTNLNPGLVRNRGIEVSLTGSPVKQVNGFTWDVGANFFANRSYVVLPPNLAVLYVTDNSIIDPIQGGAFPGKPLSGIGARDFFRAPDGRILIDPNTGYPSVNAAYTYAGNRAPDYTLHVSNTFAYHGLSLAFMLDFRKGGKVVNGNEYLATRTGMSMRTLDRYKTAVIDGVVAVNNPDGTTSYVQNTRPVELTQGYYRDLLGATGTAFIEDGSWSRLRYVTLTYAVPTKLLGTTFVKGVELSVTGRNLVLLTNYSGTDPESSVVGSGVGGGGGTGLDYGGVPATRGVDMALRATF